jgi:hypothetical protein
LLDTMVLRPQRPVRWPMAARSAVLLYPENFLRALTSDNAWHACKIFQCHSWGVECVGDFDSEKFEGPYCDRYAEGLAALHLAAGLQLTHFKKAVRGLHFHRDDPLTSKTCPGKNVSKPALIKLVQASITALTDGDDLEERIIAKPKPKAKTGIVVNVPAGDVLNAPAAASAKAPLVATFTLGETITITGEAINGKSRWLCVDVPGDTDGCLEDCGVRER